QQKVRGTTIEHYSRRRSRWRRSRLDRSVWNLYKLVGSRVNWDEGSCETAGTGCADGIQRGGATCVVGNPPGATCRAGNQPPGILQIGVLQRGLAGNIRNQIRLCVMLRFGHNRKETEPNRKQCERLQRLQ